MEWNNGLERKKFKNEMERQKKRYTKLGMSQEKIEEIAAYDKEVFNDNRSYARNTQPLSLFSEGMENDGLSPILNRNLEAFSVEMEPDHTNLLWWFDTLENEKLIQAITCLTEEEKMVLSMTVINGFTCEETGLYLKMPTSTVHYTKNKVLAKLFDLMGGTT